MPTDHATPTAADAARTVTPATPTAADAAPTVTPATALLWRSVDRSIAYAPDLGRLSRDELRATLVELLTLIEQFVSQLADHNGVSERAVMRSMGLEPPPDA